MAPDSGENLAEKILAGSTRALSRGFTWIEQGGPRAAALCEHIYPHTGSAHLIGITGSPGTGKSTLTRRLAIAAVQRKLRVGIIAVDPSSPYSGGSILGDRIRMHDLSSDFGVFIRSMASRGDLGGLCRAADDSADLMDAAGMDLVLIETVGVGQDEVDVMGLAHTVVVVTAPGLGDDIQTLKAGTIEIADLHVVNKSDRPGADQAVSDLRAMQRLDLERHPEWLPPVLSCNALNGDGVDSLLEAVLGHMQWLRESSRFEQKRVQIARSRVLRIVRNCLADLLQAPGTATLNGIQQVARREISPHAYARTLTAELNPMVEISRHA